MRSELSILRRKGARIYGKRSLSGVIALGSAVAAFAFAVLGSSNFSRARNVKASPGIPEATGMGTFGPTIPNKIAAPSPVGWAHRGKREFTMGTNHLGFRCVKPATETGKALA